MKQYSYIVRDSSGSLQRSVVSANSRVEVIQDLNRQGFVVVSVSEEQIRFAKGRMRVSPRYSMVAGAVLLVVVVLFVIIISWQSIVQHRLRMSGSNEGPAINNSAGSTRTNVISLSAHTSDGLELPIQPVQPEPAVGEEVPVAQNATTPIASIIETNPMPEAPVEPIRPAYFTATDKMLSLLVRIRPGEHMPELMITPDVNADFEKAIKTDVWLYNDDTQDEYDTKIAVAEMKQELKKYVEEGGTISNFFAKLQQQRKDEYNERITAQAEFLRLSQTSEKEALLYFKEANERLGKKGIKPLNIPKKE